MNPRHFPARPLSARRNFTLTIEQKMDARGALRLLEGTEISLTEAARRAVEGRKAIRRVTLQEVIDLFLRHKLNDGVRPMTMEWYDDILRSYGELHGERGMDTISRAEIREWIQARQGVSENTKAAHARALRSVWRWALAHEPPLVGVDITAGMRTTSIRGKDTASEIAFLPVKTCGQIMAGAGAYRSALALMLFAGIRPGEVAGKRKPPLLWRHVRMEERIIRIPGEIAKVAGRPRLLEGLPETLWKWLEPAEENAAVCPARAMQAVKRAQEKAGYDGSNPWPHDALRHTFATYHVAAFNDPGRTSIILGHEGNPTMLHRHYRGLTTKAEAERFWALEP